MSLTHAPATVKGNKATTTFCQISSSHNSAFQPYVPGTTFEAETPPPRRKVCSPWHSNGGFARKFEGNTPLDRLFQHSSHRISDREPDIHDHMLLSQSANQMHDPPSRRVTGTKQSMGGKILELDNSFLS